MITNDGGVGATPSGKTAITDGVITIKDNNNPIGKIDTINFVGNVVSKINGREVSIEFTAPQPSTGKELKDAELSGNNLTFTY